MACGCSGPGPCSCRIVDSAGNPIPGRGTAGDPYVLPPAGSSELPAPGCGLRVAGDSWEAATTSFAELTREACTDTNDSDPTQIPFDPACELNGAPVYCGSDGLLRTLPEKHTEVEMAAINEAITPGVTRADLPWRSGFIERTITNPSDCYCLCGYLTYAFIPGISAEPNAVLNVFHEIDLGTGTFTATTGFVFDQRGKTAQSGGIQRPTVTLPLCLDPGEAKTIRYRVAIESFTGDNPAADFLLTGLAKDLRFVGSNL
jgi:hypothetical protein